MRVTISMHQNHPFDLQCLSKLFSLFSAKHQVSEHFCRENQKELGLESENQIVQVTLFTHNSVLFYKFLRRFFAAISYLRDNHRVPHVCLFIHFYAGLRAFRGPVYRRAAGVCGIRAPQQVRTALWNDGGISPNFVVLFSTQLAAPPLRSPEWSRKWRRVPALSKTLTPST